MERIDHSRARRRDHRLRSGALANRSHGWPRGESSPDIRLKWGKGSDLDDLSATLDPAINSVEGLLERLRHLPASDSTDSPD